MKGRIQSDAIAFRSQNALQSAWSRAPSAQAAALTDAQIKAYLKAANPGVELDSYRNVYSGPIGNPKKDAAVVIYAICARGGNACASLFGVYVNDNGKITALPIAAEPKGQVDNVLVKGGRIFVHSQSYRATDLHCCPSIQHRQVYAVGQGVVKRLGR